MSNLTDIPNVSEATTEPPEGLRGQVVAFTLSRILINTALRMVYPFLPTFARGIGVELSAVELAVAGRSALGLLGPLFSRTAEQRGRRTAMLLALGLFISGGVLVALWPTFPGFVIALLLTGSGKIIFDPAVQAYVGDAVPYAQRGRVLAITELSWSMAFIIGMPTVGFLIGRFGWSAPFPVLAVLAVVMALAVLRLVPTDPTPEQGEGLQALRLRMLLTPTALAGIGIGLLISMGNEIVNISFAAWLEGSFGLQIAALGLTAAVLGLADLLGEGVVIGFVDRIGKRRLLTIGMVCSGAANIALPFIGQFSSASALAGLFLIYLTFEVALVSSIPIMTELLPSARATMMGAYLAAASAGRMLGAVIGPALFDLGGLPMLPNGLAALLINGVALVLLFGFIQRD